MKTGPGYRYQLVGIKKRRKSSHDVFDGTLQKTNVWLNDIMNELDWQEHPYKAYLALRTVLHVLRDRLTIEEAVQLGAQLPMLVRGLYYEGWTLKGKPGKERHKEDFLTPIKEAFKEDFSSRPESIARAVFKTLARHTSAGEIEDVKHSLPKAMNCGRRNTLSSMQVLSRDDALPSRVSIRRCATARYRTRISY